MSFQIILNAAIKLSSLVGIEEDNVWFQVITKIMLHFMVIKYFERFLFPVLFIISKDIKFDNKIILHER